MLTLHAFSILMFYILQKYNTLTQDAHFSKFNYKTASVASAVCISLFALSDMILGIKLYDYVLAYNGMRIPQFLNNSRQVQKLITGHLHKEMHMHRQHGESISQITPPPFS
jgi:hypothetical protein